MVCEIRYTQRVVDTFLPGKGDNRLNKALLIARVVFCSLHPVFQTLLVISLLFCEIRPGFSCYYLGVIPEVHWCIIRRQRMVSTNRKNKVLLWGEEAATRREKATAKADAVVTAGASSATDTRLGAFRFERPMTWPDCPLSHTHSLFVSLCLSLCLPLAFVLAQRMLCNLGIYEPTVNSENTHRTVDYS